MTTSVERSKMWEPGVYSLVRFSLEPAGSGTKVVLDLSLQAGRQIIGNRSRCISAVTVREQLLRTL
jgi:hypothetical protein